MSPEEQKLERFLEWLLTRPEWKTLGDWKREHCRKLQRLKARVEKVERECGMRSPNSRLAQAAALIGKEIEDYRRGKVFEIGGKKRILAAKWNEEEENERLFVAVRVAHYLNPDPSAYAEVVKPLTTNLNCELKSLEQRVRRFEEHHSDDRLSMLNRASDLYCMFLMDPDTTPLDRPVVMTEAETDLLWTAIDRDGTTH